MFARRRCFCPPPSPAVSTDLFARTASLRISTAEIGRDKATVRPGASRRPPRCLIGLFCLLATAVGSPAARAQDEAAPTGISLAVDTDADTTGDQNTVAEDGTPQTVTVRAALTGGTTRTEATPVTVTVAAGTATLTTDYSVMVADPFTITIPAGDASATGTFTITPVDDNVFEGDETVEVTGSTTVQGLTVSAADPALTITNADAAPAAIVISVDPVSVGEGSGTTEITVTASYPADGSTVGVDSNISVFVNGGVMATTGPFADIPAADEDVDFKGSGNNQPDVQVEIPAGEFSGSGTVDLTVTEDTLFEGDEVIYVNALGYPVFLPNVPAWLTISDNDTAPTISLRLDPAMVTEDGGAQTVTVHADVDGTTRFGSDTEVTVSVSAGTATETTDYAVTTAPGTITIAAGAATASTTFAIMPVNDTIAESGGETVTVEGASGSLTVNPAPLTITDDDAAEPDFGSEDVDDQTWTVGEAIAAVTLPAATGGNGTLTYTLTPDITAYGLTLTNTASTKEISGTPTTALITATAFTWTATDADSDTDTVTFDVTIGKGTQSLSGGGDTFALTFGDDAPALPTIAQDPATGGGTVEYDSSDDAVCTIDTDGGNLAIEASGGCIVTATITGNANYDALTAAHDVAVITVTPAAPAIGVTAGDGSFTLTWTDPGDSGIDAWDWRRCEPGAVDCTAWTAATAGEIAARSIVITGTNGTAYNGKLRARAGNLAGAVATSEDVTPTAQQVDAPGKVAGLTATAASQTQIDLSWDATATATKYQYRYGTTSGSLGSWSADVTGASASITGLTADTTYYVQVRAGNDGGYGTPSDEASATTRQVAAPGKVAGLTAAAASPTQIDLAWDAAATATKYQYRYGATSGSPGDWSADRTGTSASLTGLTAGTTYYVQVRAGNDGGYGDPSDEASATTPSSDTAPRFALSRYAADWRVGIDIGSVALPAATGGDGALTYTLTDKADIPAGVSYDDAARTFAGTPTAAGVATLTLTARDEDGDPAALTVAIAVARGVQDLSGFAYSPARAAVDGAAPALVAPEVAGGAVLTYASETPGVCTADGNTGALTLLAAGACTVEAAAAATDDYAAAAARFTVEVTAAGAETRERLAAVNESVVPELGQALAASAAEAVSGRLDAALSGGGPAATTGFADALSSVAGALGANERALSGESFALGLSGDGGSGTGDVAFWGSGEWRRLSLDGDALEWEGETFAGYLGLDAGLGADVRAGAALSWSEGSIDYTDRNGAAPAAGTLESRMASVHPYAGLSLADGGRLWATVGWGRGEIEIDDEEAAGRQSSDTVLLTAAVGGAARLASGGATAFDLKGEAQTARLEVDDNGDLIDGVTANTRRLRLALEGSRAFALSSGALLTPSLEAGMRWDGGDGATGAGFELGVGVGWADRASGLTAEISGRALAAHAGDLREWGASGFVRLDPGADGRGLSLSVVPSWGETGSGLSQLWDDGMTARAADGAAPVGRIDAELGYGLAALDGAGLVTPYSGAALADDGARRYRLGGRFGLGAGLALSLEASRRESGSDMADHGIGLRGALRW